MSGTVVTYAPASISSTNNFTNVGGASFLASLTDGLDTSYAQQTSAGSNGYVGVSWPTSISIPAGAKILQVYLRYRAAYSSVISGNPQVSSYLAVPGYPGPAGTVIWYSPTLTTTPTWYTTPVMSTDPSGNPWTVTSLNSGMYTYFGVPWQMQINIYEVQLIIVYNAAPVVASVTWGNGLQSVRPYLSWSYSDAESDPCAFVRIKIFTDAQVAVGGFNPDTSPNTYDTGDIPTNTTYYSVPIDLAAGLGVYYNAYVKAADAYSGMRYSAWASTGSHVQVNPTIAATPTITSVTDGANFRNIVTVTGNDSTGTVSAWLGAGYSVWLICEYSDDGGTTWIPVRNSPFVVTNSAAENNIFYDYEYQSSVNRIYRARTMPFNLNVGGQPRYLTSPNSGSTAAISQTITDWQLKVPQNPALNTTLTNIPVPDTGKRHPEALVSSKDETIGWFSPLGRKHQVPVYDTVQGEIFNFLFEFTTLASKNAFEAIRNNQQTVYLQAPTGDSWYLRFDVTRSMDWMMTYNPTVWLASIPAREVDRP